MYSEVSAFETNTDRGVSGKYDTYFGRIGSDGICGRNFTDCMRIICQSESALSDIRWLGNIIMLVGKCDRFMGH